MATIAPFPTLVLAALAAVAMAGCAVSVDLDDDTTRRIEEDSLPLGDLDAISISTDNGQVDVIAGNVTAVELRTVLVESDRGDAGYTVRREDTGATERLVIDGECDGGWLDRCSVGFRVVVPAEFDVDITTDNGRIDIDGIGGHLDVRTDNGAIDGDDLSAVTVFAETDNGRIELAFSDAPSEVDTQTDNGRIVVRVPDGETYDVDATSDNGAVEIDVADADDVDRRIRARSDNGAIDIEYTDLGS